jgi:hypothetical protein
MVLHVCHPSYTEAQIEQPGHEWETQFKKYSRPEGLGMWLSVESLPSKSRALSSNLSNAPQNWMLDLGVWPLTLSFVHHFNTMATPKSLCPG